MSMKYAEITIIRNLKEETIVRAIQRYLGYENITNELDTIITHFDDNSIYDIKDEYIDKKLKFGVKVYNNNFPIYFDVNEHTLFFRTPNKVNDKKTINFKEVFKNFNKYNNSNLEASNYNVIYEDVHKKEILSIVKIKSNEEKPRFLLAYDDSIIDRKTVIYLIDSIFKDKFN